MASLIISELYNEEKRVGYRVIDCKSGEFTDLYVGQLIDEIKSGRRVVANAEVKPGGIEITTKTAGNMYKFFPTLSKKQDELNWPVRYGETTTNGMRKFILEEIGEGADRKYRVSTSYGEVTLENAGTVEELEASGNYVVFNRYRGRLLGTVRSKSMQDVNKNCQAIYEYTTRIKMLGNDTGEFAEYNGGVRVNKIPRSSNGVYVVPDFVSELSEAAFGGVGDAWIKLNAGLKKIGPYCFYKCNITNKLVIPSTLTEIDDVAFIKTTLHSIEIEPGALAGIKNGATWMARILTRCVGAGDCKKLTLHEADAVEFMRWSYWIDGEDEEVYTGILNMDKSQYRRWLKDVLRRHSDRDITSLRVPVKTAEDAICLLTSNGEYLSGQVKIITA